MSPVSFVKTTKSYEAELITIIRQIAYDFGILPYACQIIRGLPLKHTRFADWVTLLVPRDFFPPCRGPGAQFSLGTSLNDSDCSHWEELSGGTTRLPWVASRKPEERILEVEKYPRDLQMFQHTSLALISV